MAQVQTRRLFELLNSLGEDPNSVMPAMLGAVTPSYILDDLSLSLPNRSSITVHTTIITSAAAAEFAIFVLVPRNGFYVKRLLSGAASNMGWGLTALGSALTPIVTTQDPSTNAIAAASWPESTNLQAGLLALNALGTTSILSTAANSPLAPLFSVVQFGRATAAASLSVFTAANRDVVSQESPIWVGPGVAFWGYLITANQAGQFVLELEFGAADVPVG